MKKKHIAERKGRHRRPAGGSWSRIALAMAGLGLIGLLGGCASKAPEYADQLPESMSRNPDDIPDAVPKVEPKSKYGNMESYVVRGRRYFTKESSQGHVERGLASWYGPHFHRRKTSSGEQYDMYAMTAAHKTLPLPTYARVTNVENGRSAVVKINDRGPFHDPRILDLSFAAATKLGVVAKGTAFVEVRAIDPANPSSDPGPFLAAKSAKSGLPMLADNVPRPAAPVQTDDDWSVGASPSARTAPPPAARESAFDASPAPALAARSESATRERAYAVALAATDARPVRETSLDTGIAPTPRQASPSAQIATRERAYESVLAATDAESEREPSLEAGIAPAPRQMPASATRVEAGPRISAASPRPAPKPKVAADLDAAERAALSKLDAPEVVAATQRPAPRHAAATLEETPEVAAGKAPKDASKVAVAKTAKDAPKLAAGKAAKDAPKLAAGKAAKDAPKLAAAKDAQDAPKLAAGKAAKDAPKLAAGKAAKDAPKLAAGKAAKDAPKLAAAKDAPKPAAAAGQGVYLQVGAFGDRGNAERLRKRLSPHVAGQVRIQSPGSADSGLYKVRIGPFGSEGEARKVSAKLASLGVEQSRRVFN